MPVGLLLDMVLVSLALVPLGPLFDRFWTSSHELTTPVMRRAEAATILRRNSLRFTLKFGSSLLGSAVGYCAVQVVGRICEHDEQGCFQDYL